MRPPSHDPSLSKKARKELIKKWVQKRRVILLSMYEEKDAIERAAFLEEKLIEVEDFEMGFHFMDLLYAVDVVIRLTLRNKHQYKHFKLKFEEALKGIEAIKNLSKPVSLNGVEVGCEFSLPEEDQNLLERIRIKIKSQQERILLLSKMAESKLNPKGGKKVSIREMLLPYQKSAFNLMRRRGLKPGKCYQHIGEIFYAYGLEKGDSTSELRKFLPKAPLPPRKLDFLFLDRK